MYQSFCVIGGDLRQISVANSLHAEGFTVKVMGIDTWDKIDKGIEILRFNSCTDVGCDVVILPLPCSFDGETLNAPLYEDVIKIGQLFNKISNVHLVLGGKINEEIKSDCSSRNLKFCDYLEREEFAVFNAISTSEGAIELAMHKSQITIWGSKCLVMGFGRIGKVLAKMLSSIGADVSVIARKKSDLAWIETYGYKAIDFKNIDNALGRFDFVFNTIPVVILNSERLAHLKDDVLVIDLASKPGGVDFFAADSLGVKTEWALSLPGKVAPISAGKIIKTTILNIITEEGE